ncbi:MAG: sugar phosphate isomerase/epimerase [Planctomycetales bacterium]|nr:sugar phosphate isomerase/epimerase [Planctomycetales bacterium]
MKELQKYSTKNSCAMLNRRTCLAMSTAVLANATASCADFGFPKHFIGANTAIDGYGIFAAIDLLRDLGFRTIEIQNLVGDPEPIPGKFPGLRWEQTDEEFQDRIKNALSDFELITTHLPYQGLEYFAPAGELARVGVETMERSLEATAKLGAKIGVLHPKPGPGMSVAETWPFMIRRIRQWGDIARAGGFRLALETGYPTSVDEFVRLVHEVDHDCVGAALDVGHQGRFEKLVRKVEPKDRGTAEGIKAYNDLNLELIDRLGAKLIHLHVHDIEPDTWREHKPLIYGFIDYERLIQRLRETMYAGVLVFEIGGSSAEMPRFLKDGKRKLERFI